MTRALRALVVLALAAGLTVTTAATAAPAGAQANPCSGNPAYDATWFSPCWDFTGQMADPFVMRVGSTYYAYATITGGSHLPVATSASPSGPWRPRPAYNPKPGGMPFTVTDPFFNDGLVRPPQWAANDASPGHSWLRQEIWAPTVAKFGSTYVAYYAVRVNGRSWDSPWDADSSAGYFGNPRFCLSYATSTSPTGPFVDSSTGPFYCGEDLDGALYGGRYGGNAERANPAGILDPSIFVDPVSGNAYLLFKTEGKRTNDLAGETGHPTEIVIRQLAPSGIGFAPGSTSTAIARTAEGSWEGMVIENPSMGYVGGRYLLFYSGGEWGLGADQGSQRPAYSMGYRDCFGPAGGCGEGPGTQFLRSDSNRGEYGPGGGSVFTDASGALWLAYQYWDTPNPVLGASIRRLRTMPISACGAVGIDVASQCNLVKAAYEDFLGRAPNEVERIYWTGLLGSGLPRFLFLAGLATSEPWLGVTVDRMYTDTLGRPGEGGGRAFWVTQLQNGAVDVPRLAANFYGSDEYFSRYGANDLGTWLDDLYVKLLHRSPEAGGRSFWTTRSLQTGRPLVALDFYQSAESRSVRVRQMYLDLLGREPDPGGLSYWSGQVLTRGDIVLAVDLASSAEYFARAQQ